MKVSKTNSFQPAKSPIANKIKRVFTDGHARLRTLIKDVFEKSESKYLVIDGKKIKERDLPNCISAPSDYQNVTWGKIKYFPEDIQKMKNMTDKECIDYKEKLIDSGRFII